MGFVFFSFFCVFSLIITIPRRSCVPVSQVFADFASVLGGLLFFRVLYFRLFLVFLLLWYQVAVGIFNAVGSARGTSMICSRLHSTICVIISSYSNDNVHFSHLRINNEYLDRPSTCGATTYQVSGLHLTGRRIP